MSAPQTLNPIDGVIMQLEQLIDWALHQQSRIGYFASLYLRITTAVRSKIGTGYFDDNSRMEALDAAFAVRYLSAVAQFRNDDPGLPPGWAVALGVTTREDLIIVQHLLLAMNAHINIDLAAAAASTCPGASINVLRDDFMKINGILAAVMTVITEIAGLSPFLHLLDDLAETEEIGIIDFSLTAATVYKGGMRNLYHIKLLGTRFLGKYDVQPDRRQVQSLLTNEWAAAHEVLNKSAELHGQGVSLA